WRVAGSVFRILQTSKPGIFGSIRSRIMKAGFSVRALCNPTAPSVVDEVMKPALRKLRVRRSTTSRSSSTMRIVLPDAGSIRSCFIAETTSICQRRLSYTNPTLNWLLERNSGAWLVTGNCGKTHYGPSRGDYHTWLVKVWRDIEAGVYP